MCDYYSNFIEVGHLKSTTSRSVIQEMKVCKSVTTLHSSHRQEFAVFATMGEQWAFEHVTSSSTSHRPHTNHSQRESRKRGENDQDTVRQMSLFRSIRVEGVTGLEEHPHSWSRDPSR